LFPFTQMLQATSLSLSPRRFTKIKRVELVFFFSKYILSLSCVHYFIDFVLKFSALVYLFFFLNVFIYENTFGYILHNSSGRPRSRRIESEASLWCGFIFKRKEKKNCCDGQVNCRHARLHLHFLSGP
jgi:hypothetical protein